MIERSFGVIPIRANLDICLIQDNHGDWGFPKGHPNKNESPKQTAQRELLEETGLKITHWVDIDPLINNYTYFIKKNFFEKQVDYFLAQVEGEVFLQVEEVQNYAWTPLNQLENSLTFDQTKALIPEIQKCCFLLKKN